MFRLPNGTSTMLIWIAFDEPPWSYEIYENSTLVFSDAWNGSNMHYKFEAIAVGWFNITLVVYDAFDNVATDAVIVEVYLPSIDILIIIPLIIGVGAVFAIVIILVKKKSG